MKCPRCKHENRAAAKFCDECAAPLGRECPNCRNLVTQAANFCPDCAYPLEALTSHPRFGSPKDYTPQYLADRILNTKASLAGERKHVTVLFSDIKGSMELLADRDPEQAQKLLDPVLERMISAVHHFEGTVNRVMGDGIMALFGAPLAHEDHAVRACYASLRMQEAVAQYADAVRRSHGLPITIRVGLNSGEIVVCDIGNDLHTHYTVVGQTAHLAARMEQMAHPGSVLATADTVRLAEGYIVAKSLGPVPVKGLPNPVETYQLTGGSPARTRLQAAAERGLTRFVGRDDEMNQLSRALGRVRSGYGEIVAIAGEAGVGKSRLVNEFVHSDRTANWLVLEANAVSYGRSTPYLPVIELLRRYFKVDPRDSAQASREKALSKIMMLDALSQDAIPPLLDLLDALDEEHPFRSIDPLQRRQSTYQAVTRLLLSTSRVQPVVVVFEDLHWSDSLTIGLLNELIVGAQNARLLLVVSYRLDYQDAWRGRPNYRQLRLDPLASDGLAELLHALLGSDVNLATLNNFLLQRAGGNPFFVEEIVWRLVDTGVLVGSRGNYRLAKPISNLDIPPTVQAVLSARIDALPLPEKRLLQEAAVIGHDVPYALLPAICGLSEGDTRRLLGNLQAGEFLYTSQLYPELQYTFKHSLTHDVAYSGLLHARCRELHALIVGVIENLYADRLSEQVERLADHATRGQLHEKAISYLRQAGAKAADRQAYPEAVSLFKQALGVLAEVPESMDTLRQAIDIRFDIRNVLQPLGDRRQIASYLQEAEALASRLGDAQRIAWVHSYFTEHFWMLGRYGQAAAAGEQALSIARELSDLPLQVVTNLPLGLAHHTRGDYRRAIECFNWNAVQLKGEHAKNRFGMFVLPSAFSRSFIAWAHAELGEFETGSTIGEEALRIAEVADHPFSCGYAHLGLGVVSLRKGDVRHAVRSLEHALGAGAFADSPVGFAYVALHLGYGLALSDQPAEGIAMLIQTVNIAESKGFLARHALRLAYLGEAYMIAGRNRDASETASLALKLAQEHDEQANQAYALRVLAEVAALSRNLEEAKAHFDDALLLSRQLGMKPLEANCDLGLANVLKMMDQPDAAAAHRACALDLARQMRMRFWGDRL